MHIGRLWETAGTAPLPRSKDHRHCLPSAASAIYRNLRSASQASFASRTACRWERRARGSNGRIERRGVGETEGAGRAALDVVGQRLAEDAARSTRAATRGRDETGAKERAPTRGEAGRQKLALGALGKALISVAGAQLVG